jgi:hypothetical protein
MGGIKEFVVHDLSRLREHILTLEAEFGAIPAVPLRSE